MPNVEGGVYSFARATLGDTMGFLVGWFRLVSYAVSGAGAFDAMKEAGLRPFITDIESADEAVRAYLDGKLDSHTERLH